MATSDWQARMLDDLHLRGLSDTTRKAYLRAVRKLSEHCKRLGGQSHFADGSGRLRNGVDA